MELEILNDSIYARAEFNENVPIEESGFEGDSFEATIMPITRELETSKVSESFQDVEFDSKDSMLHKMNIKGSHRVLKTQETAVLWRILASVLFILMITKLMSDASVDASKKIGNIPGEGGARHDEPSTEISSAPSLGDEKVLENIGLLKAKNDLAARFEERMEKDEYGDVLTFRLKPFSQRYDRNFVEDDGEIASFEIALDNDNTRFEDIRNCKTREKFYYLRNLGDDDNFFEEECITSRKLFRAISKKGESSKDILNRTGFQLPQYFAEVYADSTGDLGKSSKTGQGIEHSKSLIYPMQNGMKLNNILKEDISLDERLYIARQLILSVTHLHMGGIKSKNINAECFLINTSGDLILSFPDKLFIYNDPVYYYKKYKNVAVEGSETVPPWSMKNDYGFIEASQENIKELGTLLMDIISRSDDDEHLANSQLVRRFSELAELLVSASPDTSLKLFEVVAEFSDILGK